MTIEQIYWGAVPFVLIQIVMVGLIIAFPGLVTSGLTKETTLDADKVFQQLRADSRASDRRPACGPGGMRGAAGQPRRRKIR